MLTALLVAVLGGTFIFNGVTYALWLYENRVHGAARHARSGPLLPTLTAWAGEALAGLVVSLSWPVGLLERRRVTPASGRPVLLIPGWSLNRASMAVLAARLRRAGRDAYPINYSTSARDSERKGTEVAEAILDVARRTRAPRWRRRFLSSACTTSYPAPASSSDSPRTIPSRRRSTSCRSTRALTPSCFRLCCPSTRAP